MNDSVNSPYASPLAELVEKNDNQKIHEFTRFSAWGVFGLLIITLGIYPIYWHYTRAEKINSFHDNKINKAWLIALVLSFILSIFMEFLGDSNIELILSLVVSIVYLVAYIVVSFSIRNRLQDITKTRISGILTFFFSAIYLQYKINENIDNSVAVPQETS